MIKSCSPVDISHILIVPSAEPDARTLSSGLNAILVISSECRNFSFEDREYEYDLLKVLILLQRGKCFSTEIYRDTIYQYPIKNPQNLSWGDLIYYPFEVERYPHHFEIRYHDSVWEITFHGDTTTEYFETTPMLEAYNEIVARIIAKHEAFLSK